MPLLLALGSVAVSALFGAGFLMDKVKETEAQTERSSLNVGGLVLIGIGGLLLWHQMSKR